MPSLRPTTGNSGRCPGDVWSIAKRKIVFEVQRIHTANNTQTVTPNIGDVKPSCGVASRLSGISSHGEYTHIRVQLLQPTQKFRFFVLLQVRSIDYLSH